MSHLFYQYLNQRLHHHPPLIKSKAFDHEVHGPIITISRQAGCSGKDLAILLQKAINKNVLHPEDKWRCIDKDMMKDSAQKLNLPVRKIKYIYNGLKKSNMDQIFESFSSRYYKSDRVIRRTIIDVMKEYAKKGNMVMIGRAGVVLAPYVTKSFNIRLVAPLNWRINQISNKHKVSTEEAQKYIAEMDRNRSAMIKSFTGGKLEEAMFDITFNCAQVSIEDIVETCISLIRKRSFIR